VEVAGVSPTVERPWNMPLAYQYGVMKAWADLAFAKWLGGILPGFPCVHTSVRVVLFFVRAHVPFATHLLVAQLGENPFHLAARCGAADVVDWLCGFPEAPDLLMEHCPGLMRQRPLEHAASGTLKSPATTCHFETVKLLIEKHHALQLLSEQPGSVFNLYASLLVTAARSGNPDIVQYIANKCGLSIFEVFPKTVVRRCWCGDTR
jgi:hypothetical protein